MLITKGDLVHQWRKLDNSGITHHFAHIDVVREKDEATYRRVLEDVDVAPERFCMVGNSVRSDVLPVLGLGGHAVHIEYQYTWEHELVEHDEAVVTATSILDVPGARRAQLPCRVWSRAEYLDVLQHEATSLLAAARPPIPSAPVPGCPDWTTTDLVWHIGEVHDFWGYVVRERSMTPDEYEDPARPSSGRRRTRPSRRCTRSPASGPPNCTGSCPTTDPATPVWTWTPKQDVAFVIRRMAHETAAHRVDAEHAAGREHRLDPALGRRRDRRVPGLLPRQCAGRRPRRWPGRCTCTAPTSPCRRAPASGRSGRGEGAACVVSRDHAKADTALRGEAHDLLMVLWRRAPLDAVTVFGDEALAQAFVGRAGTE